MTPLFLLDGSACRVFACLYQLLFPPLCVAQLQTNAARSFDRLKVCEADQFCSGPPHGVTLKISTRIPSFESAQLSQLGYRLAFRVAS